MSREIFSLSDQTRDTLTDNVGAVSGAMRKYDKYFYAILSDDKTDPFAPFENLYKGVLKAKLPTCHWDNHLEFLRYRFGGNALSPKTAIECFKEKMSVHALTLSKLVEAFSDGIFDDEEIKTIEECLDKEERNIKNIRAMLNHSKMLVKSE